MAATCTIGGVAYIMIEDQHDLTNALDERQRFKCDIIDYAGTAHFVKGEQVVVSDPVLGIIFNGYVSSDKEIPQYPSGAILHSIDCIDQHYLADKRTYTRTYTTPSLAGKIAVDHLHDVLLAEGVTQNFAEHFDTTPTDFSQGIITSTIGASNVGDGDLELAPAGSNVTILEQTTADFSTGTLSNVTAVSNTLTPTTVSGLAVTATLPFGIAGAFLNVNFWGGSKALGTSDTFNYDIWIASTSPQIMCTVGLIFNDGTTATGIVDQNNLAIDATTDLTNYAKDKWYTRNISTTTYNGKTIANVFVGFGGTSQGTYTVYVKNVYLTSASGSPFFSTTAVATQLNPMQVISYSYYTAALTTGTVIPVFDPATSMRTSPSHSISAVQLLGSSVVTWVAGTPGTSGFNLNVSYDGGVTYQHCTNNSALPGLPSGSNVAGLNIILQETFGAGTNPSLLPNLQLVNIVLNSAPNATKSDIVTTFATQTAWNTGTYVNTQALVNGDLEPIIVTRDWNNHSTSGQTFFLIHGGITESASTGAYVMTMTHYSGSVNYAQSRLDFIGSVADFILDIDTACTASGSFVGITYRQTYWSSPSLGSYGYLVQYTGAQLWLWRGSNSSSSSATMLASVSFTNLSTHLRIVVSGGSHQIYAGNATTPTISVFDSTYTSAGNIALYGENSSPTIDGSATWDNLVLTYPGNATWQGPSTSISSLGTCGLSALTWVEVNTGNSLQAAVSIESSVDGGSTYQVCTNGGPIPNLPSGTNVSGKSVKLLISFTYSSTALPPIVRQLVWRVLGQYPGSSGNRTTAPLGNDTMVRANVVSGFGTGFDSQTYTQVGTGTTSLTSNEAAIANTTGDVHMIYGSRTWTDEDGTVRFLLSAATISAGIELRYTDTNNFYRLQASTTTVSIVKKQAGISQTLASVSMTITTGTWYRMRFRVTGATQPLLQGNVWLDGTLENTISPVTGLWNNSNWTIQAAG